jgi:hypothetical protein
VKPICDWGPFNWALLPTIIVGGGVRERDGKRYGWVYIYWLRGRLGASLDS